MEEKFFNELPETEKSIYERKQLTPEEAILSLARLFKGPGVRALQILPQYIPLTPESRTAFQSVFSSERGQMRVAAYQTIEREAPQLLAGNAQLGRRIGGESQATVYDYLGPNGEERVLKIAVPNAEYFVNQKLDLADRIVDGMLKLYPNHKELTIIKEQLIPDLRQWMIGDINDERFHKLDSDFRKKWQGWKADKKSRYSIYVPESFDLNSKYIKYEDKVKGAKTLDQFRISKDTNFEKGTLSEKDWGEIKHLIQEQYKAQITSGGPVHSNPTAGNYMLNPDGKLAIIDRNYYLEFTKEDFLVLAGLNSKLTRGFALNSFIGRMVKETGKNELNVGDLVKKCSEIISNAEKEGRTADVAFLKKTVR